MRPKERIAIVLKALNKGDNWERFLKDHLQECYSPTHLDLVHKHKQFIRKEWSQNPDERLFQFLINRNFLPDVHSLFFKEELGWLIKNKILKIRDVFFWRTYGKTGRGKGKNVLIKNMDTDHIENILKDYNAGRQPMTTEVFEYFKNELLYRKSERILNRTQ